MTLTTRGRSYTADTEPELLQLIARIDVEQTVQTIDRIVAGFVASLGLIAIAAIVWSLIVTH